MRPLFHSYGLNGIPRTELFLLSEQEKGGGEVALLGNLRSSFLSFFINQARGYVPNYRVPSSPQEAALLPLGSYSSYRLLGKMY